MNKRGFTIVELLVVLAVMGILLTLGVANISGTQINARDAKRKIDIDTIAAYLNDYYKNGTDGSTAVGEYQSTVLTTSGIPYTVQILRGIETKTLTAPSATSVTTSFIPATNNTQTTAGVTPQPTISQYVYQPLQSDGVLCTLEAQECRKFNLFYRLETDNTVNMLTSKNQ